MTKRFIHVVHPTRSRPERSISTINKFVKSSDDAGEVMVTICLDDNDPRIDDYWKLYRSECSCHWAIDQRDNKSSVEAINEGFKNSLLATAKGQIIMVVSDDTDCFKGWDTALYKETEGKEDYILKTQDGIQNWIITMPVMDLKYYQRFGYIYYPGFSHLFADTELTCVADILGKKIISNLLFPHNHYSIGKATLDSVYSKNDRTNEQGEKLFLERYARNFDLPKGNPILDRGMIDWLKKRRVS